MLFFSNTITAFLQFPESGSGATGQTNGVLTLSHAEQPSTTVSQVTTPTDALTDVSSVSSKELDNSMDEDDNKDNNEDDNEDNNEDDNEDNNEDDEINIDGETKNKRKAEKNDNNNDIKKSRESNAKETDFI